MLINIHIIVLYGLLSIVYCQTPTFSQKSYKTLLKEDAAENAKVIELIANYPISVKYFLDAFDNIAVKDIFSIHEELGIVRLKEKIDYDEGPTIYKANIYAISQEDIPKTGSTLLTIELKDVNDNSPEFEKIYYEDSIKENVNLGSTQPVLMVKATDRDSGDNAIVKYKFVEPQSRFNLNGDSGIITVSESVAFFDREEIAIYSFLVQAFDTGNLISVCNVTIFIEDENDNSPSFKNPNFNLRIKENLNSTNEPVIFKVIADDADEGDNSKLTYRFSRGYSSFLMNSSTGEISLVSKLNFPTNRIMQLQIQINDNGIPENVVYGNIDLYVEDVNDHEPIFSKAEYTNSILENVDIGSFVLQVKATDEDSDINSQFKYSLNQSVFVINSDGVIYTNEKLDREKQSNYRFIVQAIDFGSPSLTGSALVHISILDVNDNYPKLEKSNYDIIISEDFPILQSMLILHVTDEDEGAKGEVTCQIIRGDEKSEFKIEKDVDQWNLILDKSISYNVQSKYELIIQACDNDFGDKKCNSSVIIVNVKPANRNTPQFSKRNYELIISEDAKTGQTDLILNATDSDVGPNSELNYSLYGSGGTFGIDEKFGVISLLKGLDRENKSSYQFVAIVTDNGVPFKSNSANVRIIVEDVNDNAPIFDQMIYIVNVTESTRIDRKILTVRATDRDALKTVLYSLKGSPAKDYFKISEYFGDILITKELDRETISYFEFDIYATDTGDLRGKATVRIYVMDENDNSPIWPSEEVVLRVPESTPIGSEIGSVFASDADQGYNAIVEYRIWDGPDYLLFRLASDKFSNGSIGLISQTTLDFESNQIRYEFRMRALSGNLFSTVKIVILVTDQNDHPPELKDFEIFLSNMDNSFPSGSIGRVPATDIDVTSKLSFSISGTSADSSVIGVDEESGEIFLNSKLNTNVDLNTTVQILVSDGKYQSVGYAKLKVCYIDENTIKSSITVYLQINDGENLMNLSLFRTFIHSLLTNQFDSVMLDDILIFGMQVQNNSNRIIMTISVRLSKNQLIEPHVLREILYTNSHKFEHQNYKIQFQDDSVCQDEPCFNYYQCFEQNVFHEADSQFVSIGRDLVRSISVRPQASCYCPRGFAGYDISLDCNTEVNLCYSQPCFNEGECIPTEDSYSCLCPDNYFGRNCEFKSVHSEGGANKQLFQVTQSVPENRICHSSAQLKLEDASKKIYFCSGCPSSVDYSPICELHSVTFLDTQLEGTFLAVQPIFHKFKLKISLTFATTTPSAILLYSGRVSGQGDYLLLELLDGRLKCSVNLGREELGFSTNVSLNSSTGNSLSDGISHRVTVMFYNKTLTLYESSSDCDPALETRLVAIDSYLTDAKSARCVSSSKIQKADRCDPLIEPCYRFLDTNTPLFVGGIPADIELRNITSVKRSFAGCLKNLEIDDTLVNFATVIDKRGAIQNGCSNLNSACNQKEELNCHITSRCTPHLAGEFCQCPNNSTGKFCTISAGSVYSLNGKASKLAKFVSVNMNTIRIRFDFRSAAAVSQETVVLLKMSDGNDNLLSVNYLNQNRIVFSILDTEVTSIDNLHGVLSDGQWHNVDISLEEDRFSWKIDYGIIPSSNSFFDSSRLETRRATIIEMGLLFGGCLKAVALDDLFLSDFTKFGSVTDGCDIQDETICNPPCSPNAICTQNTRGKSICKCKPGFYGAPLCNFKLCSNISVNPCGNWMAETRSEWSPQGICHLKEDHPGFFCECQQAHGKYCEYKQFSDCPSTWWGSPLCRPCQCDIAKGFQQICDRLTGRCQCRSGYYLPSSGSMDQCKPCSCYLIGSINSQCSANGICSCRNGVSGSQCQFCDNQFAEVTSDGCEVLFDSCPKSFSRGIWWKRTSLNELLSTDCPDNRLGFATRFCDEIDGWAKPDTYSCLNRKLSDVKTMLSDVERSHLTLNNYQSIKWAALLSEVANHSSSLYGAELEISARLLTAIFNFEMGMENALEMSYMQDREFLANLITGLGHVLSSKRSTVWSEVESRSNQKSYEFFNILESFVNKVVLSETSISTSIDLFDSSIAFKTFRLSGIVKDEDLIMSSFDTASSNTTFELHIPQATIRDELFIDSGRSSTLGILSFRNLTGVIPHNQSGSLRENSPFYMIEWPGNKSHRFSNGIILTIPLHSSQGFKNHRCAFIKYSASGAVWSTDGCTVISFKNSSDSVTCSCNHLTTFTILSEPELNLIEPVVMPPAIYVIGSVTALLYLLLLIINGLILRLNFVIYKIHFCFTLIALLAILIYMIGLVLTFHLSACRLLGIFIHYLSLCSLFWCLTWTLHLYRQITEKFSLQSGKIKFYLLLAFSSPGVIVGLTIGLEAAQYDYNAFCWLPINSLVCISVILPICVVYLCCFFLWSISLYRFRNKKRELQTNSSDNNEANNNHIISHSSNGIYTISGSIMSCNKQKNGSFFKEKIEDHHLSNETFKFDLVMNFFVWNFQSFGWLLLYLGPALDEPYTWHFGVVCLLLNSIICLIWTLLPGTTSRSAIDYLRSTRKYPDHLKAYKNIASRTINPRLQEEFNKYDASKTFCNIDVSSTTSSSGSALSRKKFPATQIRAFDFDQSSSDSELSSCSKDFSDNSSTYEANDLDEKIFPTPLPHLKDVQKLGKHQAQFHRLNYPHNQNYLQTISVTSVETYTNSGFTETTSNFRSKSLSPLSDYQQRSRTQGHPAISPIVHGSRSLENNSSVGNNCIIRSSHSQSTCHDELNVITPRLITDEETQV